MLIKNNDTLVVYDPFADKICFLTLLLSLPDGTDYVRVEHQDVRINLNLNFFNYEVLKGYEILGIL